MKASRPFALIQAASRFLLVTLLSGVMAPAALALPPLPPDDYIGDASIYTGVPSERPKPNVLFLIDTSKGTLNLAAGSVYDPGMTYSSAANFTPDYIYIPGTDGSFGPNSQVVKAGNTPLTLGGVTCIKNYTDAEGNLRVVDVKNTLQTYGTYSGAGTVKFPNLATNGDCASDPQGQVYATGNYLNYINSTSIASVGDIVIQHSYEKLVKEKGVWVLKPVTERFKLNTNIDEATAAMEPGKETAGYWVSVPLTTPVTHELIGGVLKPNDGIAPINEGWQAGMKYYSEKLDPTKVARKTQRQVFYEALSSVIRGASTSVNFGFLIYNRNNQGASDGAHIKEYGSNPQPLIDLLPGMFTTSPGGNYTCTQDPVTKIWTGCNDLIVNETQRPASEALFDAGWYLMRDPVDTTLFPPIHYPTTQQKVSNTLTAQVPIDIANPCGYNHIIYLTNGLPNGDGSSLTVRELGDRDGDNTPTPENPTAKPADEGVYGAGSHYLDDVAYFLNKEADLNGDGKFGDVVTHVVLAFQNEDELLKNAAFDGGGTFQTVFDTEGLTKALLNILANIVKETDTSFVAPVVPASSTNRTRSGERVYVGLFKPQTNAVWHGNLKKYKLDRFNSLLDMGDRPATNYAGDFVYSQSFWGTADPADPAAPIIGADKDRVSLTGPALPVDTAGNPIGVPNPDPDWQNHPGNSLTHGDGGIVDAGGAGGTLLTRELRTRRIFTPVNPATQSDLIELRIQLNPYPSPAVPPYAVTYNLTPLQLGLSADAVFTTAENLKRSQLIDFMYGFNTYETTYSNEGQPVPKRKWILGDILHSKPLVRSYWPYKSEKEPTCFTGTHSTDADGNANYNSTMIYVGANDGMLHAFNDCDGSEEWAFVPPILWDKLKNLPDGTHEFYMDSSPVSYVYDANDNGKIESGDKVILVFGLRRGGGHAYLTPNTPRGAYYMLNITDPRNPEYLGQINSLRPDPRSPGYAEMGETWSQPVIDWVQDGTTAKLAMFVGAGYDNNEDRRWGQTQGFPVSTWSDDGDFTNDTDTTLPTDDGLGTGATGVTSDSSGSQLNPKGRGIYIVELARVNSATYALETNNAGSLIKAFTADNTPGMNYSFPSDVTALDWEGSDFVDRIYAADTGGQVWRIDVKDTDSTTPGNNPDYWTAQVIFRANPGYAGYPAQAADNTTGRKFFYRPDVGKDGTDAIILIGSGDREHPLNKDGKDRLYMIRDKGQTTAKTEDDLMDMTDNQLQSCADLACYSPIQAELTSSANYGWYIRLEGLGEKMLAEPVLFFGDVLYTTYKPKPVIDDPCETGNLGDAQLYHVDSLKATAVVNYCNSATAGWVGCPTDNDTGYNTLDKSSLARGKDGEVLLKSDRVVKLGKGIPSGTVPTIDPSGNVTLKVAASGRLTNIEGGKINTYYPLYWTETILK